MSRVAQDFASTASSLLTRIEQLLTELSVHDSEEKRRQVLNLIDSLSRAVSRLTTDRTLLRPSGEVIKTVSEILSPLHLKISKLRKAVLERKYEDALSELHVVESIEGDVPGIAPLCSTVAALMNLTTQQLAPEEVAPSVPEVMLSPPTDLLYGVPPVTIPLWNLLVRRGRLEKEEAKRALIPPTAPAYEQLEKDFEQAWDALVEKGYAELKVDKRGRMFLERK